MHVYVYTQNIFYKHDFINASSKSLRLKTSKIMFLQICNNIFKCIKVVLVSAIDSKKY